MLLSTLLRSFGDGGKMRKNTATRAQHDTVTHEGAPAFSGTLEQELRRAVLSCLLWEKQFYESGQSIADRIVSLASALPPETVAALAIEARKVHGLRHVPLLLLTVLAKTGAGRVKLVANAIDEVVQRADEPGELLALYWAGGRKPLPAQFKKGLARAITKFDAYQLAKYDRDTSVKLRDVLFLAHAKPKNEEQAVNWMSLVAGNLESPHTWEVELSAGADKRETFTWLLQEGNLGYLALLRNLRGMVAAGVDLALIRDAIVARKGGADKVWPFRYVAAARACPQLEPWLDMALDVAIAEIPALPGKTIVLVDVSGSMDAPLSSKSDMSRCDAAAALASIVSGDLRVFTFSNRLEEVPPRRGMAGVDAILNSQNHQGTHLGQAVTMINQFPHDRLIVVTDEQSHDQVPGPAARHAYMVNVAGYKPSIAYGPWTRIEGFSESIIRYIQAAESGTAL
jgi:60 kDa SS-A/Ro ribonucleoprotein